MRILPIGMPVHNEAPVIGRTIAPQSRQSISDAIFAAALVVDAIKAQMVPSGCSAADILKSALALSSADVDGRVCVRTELGKSNRWIWFANDPVRLDATFLLFMNVDIISLRTIWSSGVARLGSYLSHDVAIESSVKDSQAGRRTQFERTSRRLPAQCGGDADELRGQLYCARADGLRQTWLLTGFSIKDKFIAVMLTDALTLPACVQAAAFGPGDRHYETKDCPAAFIRHEAQSVVGSVINAGCSKVLGPGNCGRSGHGARCCNAENPRQVDAVREGAYGRANNRWCRPRWSSGGSLVGAVDYRFTYPAREPLAVTLASLPAARRASSRLCRPAASQRW